MTTQHERYLKWKSGRGSTPESKNRRNRQAREHYRRNRNKINERARARRKTGDYNAQQRAYRRRRNIRYESSRIWRASNKERLAKKYRGRQKKGRNGLWFWKHIGVRKTMDSLARRQKYWASYWSKNVERRREISRRCARRSRLLFPARIKEQALRSRLKHSGRIRAANRKRRAIDYQIDLLLRRVAELEAVNNGNPISLLRRATCKRPRPCATTS